MSTGDTINQSGNFQIGYNKGNTTLSSNQSFNQHITQLVNEIDRADAPEQAKAEAKSRLQAFLKHPLVTTIVGKIIAF
ncbi:hypothetical protein [Methylovulum psychrotolerans]|jgi:hypothetical protein|uniref:Uncharacterized protein n=1 Tax=Methylovulum psychrotolerans TaxID=1704499 RepID=A0A1Z4C433_9GAMM|nr:hypothetical protein [Methylovulum psychrotolerans]ASF48279.1 hypothetical protein CEK71_20655 [Methylovulum psychrotolerans]